MSETKAQVVQLALTEKGLFAFQYKGSAIESPIDLLPVFAAALFTPPPSASLKRAPARAPWTPAFAKPFKFKTSTDAKVKDPSLCSKCQTKPVSVMVLPCGHRLWCAECAPAESSCTLDKPCLA